MWLCACLTMSGSLKKCQDYGHDMHPLTHVQEPFGGILHAEDEQGRPIYMGNESMHGANLGGVTSLCDPAPHKESPMALHGWSVVYTLLEYSLRESKLEERTVLITWQQNTVAQYIDMRTNTELCLWQHDLGRGWESSGGTRRGCVYQKNGQKHRWE